MWFGRLETIRNSWTNSWTNTNNLSNSPLTHTNKKAKKTKQKKRIRSTIIKNNIYTFISHNLCTFVLNHHHFFSNQPRGTARVMPYWVFLVLIRNARIQELVYTHLPRFPRFYRILMLPKWFEHSKYFFLWFMFVTKSIFEFRVYFFILWIEIAQPTH